MFKALFAQNDYSYDAQLYNNSGSSDGAAFAAGLVVGLVILLVVVLPAIIGLWKVFKKAGKPGWAAIVPFYNYWVWIEIVGRPQSWFWILLALTLVSMIPVLGLFASIGALVFTIILSIDLAKSYGKDAGMGVLIALLPFIGLPILGFGKAKYIGPSVKPTIEDQPYPTHHSTTNSTASTPSSTAGKAKKTDDTEK